MKDEKEKRSASSFILHPSSFRSEGFPDKSLRFRDFPDKPRSFFSHVKANF